MRIVLWAALGAVLAAAGCDNTGPSAWRGGPGAASDSDELYTIALLAFTGPTRFEDSQRFKTLTEQQAGWSGLRVIHKENVSELYWGQYRSPRQAEADLKRAKTFKTTAGYLPYVTAIIIPMPGYDPGPPEWNVKNSKGVYSVVIATFYDVPEANYVGRKKFAVDYCRQLREGGEESYYFHGPSKSTVSIGSFAEDAFRDVYQKNFTWKTEVQDRAVLKVLAKYPYMAVNGRGRRITVPDAVTHELKTLDAPSYPFRIPGRPSRAERPAMLKDLEDAGFVEPLPKELQPKKPVPASRASSQRYSTR
jgi:hypothetical protein